jgi:hypothetical protein
MCQTALISKNIVRIGMRSFGQNLEAAAGNTTTRQKIASLNHSIDTLYDLLYEQYNDITPADYKIFGPQLRLLLDSLKNLYTTYKKDSEAIEFSDQVERLGRNYSALYEIDRDIKHFRLSGGNATGLNAALKEASQAISHIGK